MGTRRIKKNITNNKAVSVTTFKRGPIGGLIYFVPKRRIPRNKIREGVSMLLGTLGRRESHPRRTPPFMEGLRQL
jgi:hypothetical protein